MMPIEAHCYFCHGDPQLGPVAYIPAADLHVCGDGRCVRYMDRACSLADAWCKLHAELLDRCDRQGWPRRLVMPEFRVFAALSLTAPAHI